MSHKDLTQGLHLLLVEGVELSTKKHHVVGMGRQPLVPEPPSC